MKILHQKSSCPAIPNLNPSNRKTVRFDHQPSTNRSRILEFMFRHSYIRGKFVDGLKKNNKTMLLGCVRILDLELLAQNTRDSFLTLQPRAPIELLRGKRLGKFQPRGRSPRLPHGVSTATIGGFFYSLSCYWFILSAQKLVKAGNTPV